MNNKALWYFLQASCIALFLITIALGHYLFPENQLQAWSLFFGLLIVHISELAFSMKVGKNKKIPTSVMIVKTIIFGFTWWLPLKKGIIDK